MKSIEVIKLGTKRRGREILRPGTYDLCRDSEFVVLRVRCSIETEETFNREGGVAEWRHTGYHVDTLMALPTLWQRLKAFVLFREQPLPRAVLITRSAKP